MVNKKLGFNVRFAFTGLLLFGAVAFLNGAADNVKFGRFDLTENGIYTVGGAAKDVLSRLDVPIQVICPESLGEDDALRSTFHLSIASDGHDYLHRQIDTGRWGILGQAGRAVAMFTLALVAIAAL